MLSLISLNYSLIKSIWYKWGYSYLLIISSLHPWFLLSLIVIRGSGCNVSITFLKNTEFHEVPLTCITQYDYDAVELVIYLYVPFIFRQRKHSQIHLLILIWLYVVESSWILCSWMLSCSYPWQPRGMIIDILLKNLLSFRKSPEV